MTDKRRYGVIETTYPFFERHCLKQRLLRMRYRRLNSALTADR